MLLEVKNLTKYFGGLSAVNNVSINIKNSDEIIGIIGPNGAGKSTFFNLVAGVIPKTSGEIFFNGESINKLSPDKISKKGIARTFQNIRLFNKLTAKENVLVSLLAHDYTNWLTDIFKNNTATKNNEKKANELLEFVGLKSKKEYISSNLPYGDQRRLEIARALASNPKLIFLDEPAAGMNPVESKRLVNLLKSIHSNGTTVVLIEHDMKLVMEVCDRIIVLNRGQKLAEGIPEEIRNNDEVITAYLGQEAK